MDIQLSDHFTYKKLLRFVLSPVLMMVFTSIYGVVDGLFVSNFAGEDAFAALNLIFPFIMVVGAVGFMLGSGGTAIVSKTLGEGKKELANKYFSLLVIFTAITGIVLGVICCFVSRPVSIMLGSQGGENATFEGDITDLCVQYAVINFIGMPFFMLQNLFQGFFITAERPKTGFVITIIAGVTNMVLDALLVGVFRLGIVGAALATILSQFVGGIVPVFYFLSKRNTSILKLTKTKWYGKAIGQSCFNGSSELLSNIASSIVSVLYNFQLIKYAGMDGLSAFGVIMYVQFVFAAIYIGYSIGVAPIIGYNFGAKNTAELKNIFRKSLILIAIGGVCMLGLSYIMATPLAKLFVGYNDNLCQLTEEGLKIYAFSFMICGFNIFGSAFFTALSNGLISALISFIRSLVFQTASVLILPTLFDNPVDGIWCSIIVAELCAIVLTAIFTLANGKKYGYLDGKKLDVQMH